MKLDEFKQAFADSHPMAVDFPEAEYLAQEAQIAQVAIAAGYRLAGVRLGRAVFTTKPRAPDAPDGSGREAEPSPVEPGSEKELDSGSKL